MAALIPTPVYLQDLMTITADINLFNDGINTQLVSPRTRAAEALVVQVMDCPLADSVSSGVANANVVNSLVDTTVDFTALGIVVGDSVVNTANQDAAVVTAIATTTNPNDTLVLGTNDIFPAGTEAYKAISAVFYTQKFGTGEGVRSRYKDGENRRVTYTFPTAGTETDTIVHQVVYPVTAPNNTGNYPPAANA